MKREAEAGAAARPAEGNALWRRLLMRMRADRRVELAVYGGVALLVVALYLLGGAGKGEPAAAQGEQPAAAQGELAAAELEERLEQVLSCIRGAGRVDVMITYDSGPEIVPAMSTNVNSTGSETSEGSRSSSSQQSTESTEPATVSGSGGNEPIVLKEIEPVVRGVIVVAEGAADIEVRIDLQRAVRAVLDIPLSRIEVFERSAQPNQ